MFFGEKLKHMRALHGLSRKGLADKLSISEQAEWQYETNSTIPRIEVLNQLRTLLLVDTKYFFTKDTFRITVSPERVAFRSKDRESRKKAKQELTYISYLNDYVGYFESFLTAPTTVIGQLQKTVQTIYYDDSVPITERIQQIAETARKVLKLQNNRDLMYALEMSGIYIVEKDLGAVNDAYSATTEDNRPFIVLGNLKKSAVRRNFDLAHELGHLLMHTTVDMDSLSNNEHRTIEREADSFAAAFLMPQAEFTRDYGLIRRHSNPDAYIELKQKYLVSIVALGYRAYKLGLMTYQENRYFFGQLHKKDYVTFEPLDDQLPPIRPSRIKSLIQLLFDKQVLQPDDLTNQFHILPEFIEKLFDLDTGFFRQYQRPKQAFVSPGQIIPFKR